MVTRLSYILTSKHYLDTKILKFCSEGGKEITSHNNGMKHDKHKVSSNHPLYYSQRKHKKYVHIRFET